MSADEAAKAEARRKREEMEAVAERADLDTEDKLVLLENMMAELRVDAALKARYERLRDQLVAQLKREGPRYFVDPQGQKRYAYAVTPETVDVDVAELERMYRRGEVPEEVLDEVAPRKLDRDGFRRAASRRDASRKLTRQQVAKVSQIVPKGKGHVGFSKPLEEDDDE